MAIYFILEETHQAVKIGYSRDADARRRVASLQTGHPGELRLLGVNPEGRLEHERAIHVELRSHLRRGEWFDYDAEVVKACCQRCMSGWLPEVELAEIEKEARKSRRRRKQSLPFGNVRCPKCNGRKKVPDSRFCSSARICPTCEGSGIIDYRRAKCQSCDGLGFVKSEKSPRDSIPRMVKCPDCDGRCWHEAEGDASFAAMHRRGITRPADSDA